MRTAHDGVLLGALRSFYERKMPYCDLVLVVGGVEFQAHRAILSARSGVFKTRFRDHVLERNSRVQVSKMHKDTFEELLRFIYTGTAKNSDNMTNLLATIGKHVKSLPI